MRALGSIRSMDLLKVCCSTGVIFRSKEKKWWETFHKLVNHGNLDRNEGENQNHHSDRPSKALATVMTAQEKIDCLYQ